MNIYTVPHTGTHFILGLMNRNGPGSSYVNHWRFYNHTYRMDYLETMTTQDPITKRIQMGIDKETIKQSFGLTDKEYDDKLREIEGPKKRGPKPKKTKL